MSAVVYAALAEAAAAAVGLWAVREVHRRVSPGHARHARRGARPVDLAVLPVPRSPDQWAPPRQRQGPP